MRHPKCIALEEIFEYWELISQLKGSVMSKSVQENISKHHQKYREQFFHQTPGLEVIIEGQLSEFSRKEYDKTSKKRKLSLVFMRK